MMKVSVGRRAFTFREDKDLKITNTHPPWIHPTQDMHADLQEEHWVFLECKNIFDIAFSQITCIRHEIKFWRKTLKTTARKLKHGYNCVFQQDNVPKHTSIVGLKITKWKYWSGHHKPQSDRKLGDWIVCTSKEEHKTDWGTALLSGGMGKNSSKVLLEYLWQANARVWFKSSNSKAMAPNTNKCIHFWPTTNRYTK